jgi:predicted O-methyltransferase YrrM
MNETTWGRVDAYVEERLLGEDAVQTETLRQNAADGLRPIDVSPAQGKFLNLLARIAGARRILEVGTLGGYSTIWLARALPSDGRLVTLEYEPRHAETARKNIARAGLADRVEVRVGAAADTLPVLEAEGAGPFDLVFIDADKPNNTVYLDWAVKLSRPGTVIVLDNVVRDGAVADVASTDANVLGSRAAFDLFAGHPRLDATALQTVGSKGYDGFALAIVI